MKNGFNKNGFNKNETTDVYDKIVEYVYEFFSRLEYVSYIGTYNFTNAIFYPFEILYATDFKITNNSDAFRILFKYIECGKINTKCVNNCLRQHVQNVYDIYAAYHKSIESCYLYINKPDYKYIECVVFAMQLLVTDGGCNELDIFKSNFMYLKKIAEERASTEDICESLKYGFLYQYLLYLYNYIILKEAEYQKNLCFLMLPQNLEITRKKQYQEILDFIKKMQDKLCIEENIKESVCLHGINEEWV